MTIKPLTYFLYICYFFASVLCKMPQVYYANLGGQARLQCNANFLCYSTYTFQNSPHVMLSLNSSLKYQISGGYVTINNIKDTDAGFYTCSSVCNQMKSDQISYFVHPVSMGQPLDLSKSWVAIPPLPDSNSNDNMDNYFVVVSDERLYAAKNAKILSDGEIAGLVIGLFFGLLLTAAVIIGLILLNKRRTKKNREKMLTSKRSDKDTASSIDYSTIERDFTGESATNTLTRDSNNRLEEANRKKTNQNDLPTGNLRDIVSEIKTKDIEGPKSYRIDNFNSLNDMMNNQGDLPNIDINIGSGNSYQNQLFDNFKEDKNPTPPKNQYVNQPLIQFPQINSRKPLNQPKENRLDSLSELDSLPKLDSSHPNIASAIAGAVTVVSARTPAVREQRPSLSSNQSAKQNPGKQISFSQRIETTSTPFQLHVPSQSFREVDYTTNYFKDGATDV